MMVFLPGYVVEELVDESEEPNAAFAHFLRSELNLPVEAGEHGIRATRGRLDFKKMASGDIRVMHHEIH